MEPTSDYDELPLNDIQKVLVVNKIAADLDSTSEKNSVSEEKKTYIIDQITASVGDNSPDRPSRQSISKESRTVALPTKMSH